MENKAKELANKEIENLRKGFYKSIDELKKQDHQWSINKVNEVRLDIIYYPFSISFQWFYNNSGCDNECYLFIGLFEEINHQILFYKKLIDEVRLIFNIEENERVIWYNASDEKDIVEINGIFEIWKNKLLKQLDRLKTNKIE